MLLVAGTASVPADDFVDDVYYLPQVELRRQLTSGNNTLTPHYDKNVREIVFLDDTVANVHPDTVRAIIRR